jgi:hypothetical protein
LLLEEESEYPGMRPNTPSLQVLRMLKRVGADRSGYDVKTKEIMTASLEKGSGFT